MIRSIVLYTEEIDDLELATEELFSQASGFEPDDNTFGIICMDVDTDYPELYGRLREKWDFPIVGGTAIGTLTGKDGFCKTGISVMLLTSKDCSFAVGMTKGLTSDNYIEPVRETIQALKKELGSEHAGLVLTFGGKAKEGSGDDIVNAIDELGENLRLYGAYASDMFALTEYRAVCNERVESGEMAFVLFSGNINPKFLSVQSLAGKVDFSYEVTGAEGNNVFRLGNGTFLEALERTGLDTGGGGVVVTKFIQTPFITSYDKPDGNHVESLRVLTRLNNEDGSGLFLGGISEGSSLELGLFNRDDVKTSVGKAFDELFEWLKTEGTDNRTILCCSCAARFLALGNNGLIEAESYQGRLPDDVSLMGMYSYGEFCPVGDKNVNVFHNYTFTILSI